jgi:hypothetical protein
VAAEARSFGVAPEGSGHKASSAEAGVARASYAHAAACASAALAALAGVFKRRGFFVAKHAEQRPDQKHRTHAGTTPQRIKALRAAQKRLPQRKKRKKKGLPRHRNDGSPRGRHHADAFLGPPVALPQALPQRLHQPVVGHVRNVRNFYLAQSTHARTSTKKRSKTHRKKVHHIYIYATLAQYTHRNKS